MVLPQARADSDLTCTFDLDAAPAHRRGQRRVRLAAAAQPGRVRLDGAGRPDQRGGRRRRRRPPHGRRWRAEPPTRSRRGDAGVRAQATSDLARCGPGARAVRAAARRGATEAERSHCRDQLVRLHLPLVEHFARRFRNRGEPFDDLLQVGTIGLIKAIDRFDTERGVEFSTYATPDHRRRDQAALPRPGLGDPGAAPAAGAAAVDHHGHRRADPAARPLPHGLRAGRAHRGHRRGGHRGPGVRRTPTRRCPSTRRTPATTAPCR